VPTQILTIGKVVAVTFLHLPAMGKVTFVDIADEENTELLFRYFYPSPKFQKFAKTLEVDTYVAAEGDISHHTFQSQRDQTKSTLMVAGRVLRVLQRPNILKDSAMVNENAPT